jgi:hypothetical protein
MKKDPSFLLTRIISVFFISLLMFSTIYAASYYKLDSKGNIKKYDENENEIDLDPTQDILKLLSVLEILNYLDENSIEPIVKEEDDKLIIKDAYHEEVKIPIDESISIYNNGLRGLEISGSTKQITLEDVFNNPLIIEGKEYHLQGVILTLNKDRVNIKSKSVDSRILYKSDDLEFESSSFKEINLINNPDGSVSLEVEGSLSSIQIDGQKFREIKDAKFKIDEKGNLLYAKFKAVKDSEDVTENIILQTKDKKYTFRPKKDAVFEFDLENNKISAENIGEMYWFDEKGFNRFFMGQDLDSFQGTVAASISLTLNNDGKIKQVDFESGVFATSNGDFSSARGKTTMVYNKEDFERLNEDSKLKNLVLINEESILVKGSVDIKNLGDIATLYYHGREGSLMEFGKEHKKITLKEGDALFGNIDFEIEVKNGLAAFRKKGSLIIGEDNFSFEYINPEGVLEEAIIEDGRMRIKTSKDGVIIFDDFIESSLLRGPVSLENLNLLEEMISNLDDSKNALRQRISEVPQGSPDWYNLQLDYLAYDNKHNQLRDQKVGESSLREIESRIIELEQKFKENPNEYRDILGRYYSYAAEMSMLKSSESGYKYVVGPKKQEENPPYTIDYEEIKIYQNGELKHTGRRYDSGTSFRDFSGPWACV